MAKIVKNDLGYLGPEFQYRLIRSFIDEPSFFKDLNGIIDQNMFTEPYLRVIVGVMKEYYKKYESVPSASVIGMRLNEKANTEEDLQVYQEALEKIGSTTTEGWEDIQDMAEKFFKQQNWVRVANEIIRITRDGDLEKYDTLEKLVEATMSIGRKTDDESTPMSCIDSDLSAEDIVTIPTGINKIDEALGGGLDKGKLGLIIGSSGFGKTSMTTGLAAHAASQGFNVLQIVFEDTHRDIHRKYMSWETGVETRSLNKTPETTELVKMMLSESSLTGMLNEHVRILRLPTGEVTATEIKNRIRRKINEGFKPDVVIIDYFECVAPEKGSSTEQEHVKEGKTMRKFENMAQELDVAMWIPTQGNRDSFAAEIITSDKVGGSIKKVQIAQVILSISRSLSDMSEQRATLAVIKNRSGLAGMSFPAEFNNGTCRITVTDTVDFFGGDKDKEERERENDAARLDTYKRMLEMRKELEAKKAEEEKLKKKNKEEKKREMAELERKRKEAELEAAKEAEAREWSEKAEQEETRDDVLDMDPWGNPVEGNDKKLKVEDEFPNVENEW